MGAPAYEQAGADIAGTGTVNYLAKWTAGSTLGNSLIYDNGTNVGIGTTSPSSTLHVVGSIRADRTVNTSAAIFQNTVGNGIYLTLGDQTNTSAIGTNAGNLIFYNATNTTERARIDSSGNVGIGTTTPGAKLHVNGNAWVTSGSLYTDSILPYTGGTTPLSIASLIYARSDTSNVGIGTTSPGAKLEIADGSISVGKATGNVSQTNVLLSGYGYNLSGTKYGNCSIRSTYDNSTNSSTLDFYTASGAGADAFRARIDSSGNLILNSANTGATIQAAGTSQGLKLPATNGTTYNTDPNTLDCYAEKDLTATVTAEGGGTITLSSNTLKFTRIGRVVTISGRLVVGSVSAGPAPSGRFRINTGVGANEYPGMYSSPSLFCTGWNASFTGAPCGVAIQSSQYIYVDRFTTGGVGTDVAQFAQAGAEMSFSLTYVI